MKKLMRFFKEEDGATAVEYALIVALLSVTIAAAVTALSTQVSATYNAAATAMGS